MTTANYQSDLGDQERSVDMISSADFVAVAIVCTIGRLATMNLMMRIPEIGIM